MTKKRLSNGPIVAGIALTLAIVVFTAVRLMRPAVSEVTVALFDMPEIVRRGMPLGVRVRLTNSSSRPFRFIEDCGQVRVTVESAELERPPPTMACSTSQPSEFLVPGGQNRDFALTLRVKEKAKAGTHRMRLVFPRPAGESTQLESDFTSFQVI